ncbi:TetR/AcrR family transcriptional regulator [Ornithinibacillus xuwenensis]|jgi:AcrR family transcriptional regulator|uniref:TetR/AcrR family transcriptional regulator n=1 Tax=Ornithinibacillus xuwenensis TaxID=3144668 RepID=A0ABU9XNU0_9BACI
MSARKAVDKELSREIIMSAARDLFVEKGYQHVSMRQIAAKLGYSHGAIYYHFTNKAELFFALVESHFSMLDQKLEEMMDADLPNTTKLKHIFIGYIEFGLTHQSHYEIMFLVKDKEVRNFMNEGPMKTYQTFASHISELSEKRLSIRDIWSIFMALHGFVTHYIGHVVGFEEVRQAAEHHAELLLLWTKK